MQKTGIDFHLPISQNPTATKLTDLKPNVYKASVSAWYPLFFDQYDLAKLNGLMTQIKAGKVAGVQIQYDRNLALAQKLASQIQAQTSIQIILIQSSPPESMDTQYERDRVTTIVNLK
jgi:endonuclease G